MAVFDGVTTAGVTGSVSFSQPSAASPTTIKIQLIGMVGTISKSFGEVHVHTYPRNMGSPDGPCSAAAVGGHWDPGNAQSGGGGCSTARKDLCEVGDISGKFGLLSGSSASLELTDANMPLTGPF
jgi:hypothetical protein